MINPALPDKNGKNDFENKKKGWIKCSLCGLEFTENDAKSSCDKCRLVKGCSLIKCPNCGFEMPVESKKKRKE